MLVSEAQNEVRTVYRSGWVGQLVSGVLWLVSAALATWVSRSTGMLALIFGGIFIFPLTTLVLKLLGGRAALSKSNPLNALAMQVAFTLPLAIPVILWATQYRQELFYPSFMIVTGAHYLPFIFLYGMWQFGVLAVLLIAGGAALGFLGVDAFAAGAWLTAAFLLLFAAAARLTRKVEIPAAPAVRGRR
jgi:hypothetical protein